jgi:hypothetical protein
MILSLNNKFNGVLKKKKIILRFKSLNYLNLPQNMVGTTACMQDCNTFSGYLPYCFGEYIVRVYLICQDNVLH